jgi:hypothetical protein
MEKRRGEATDDEYFFSVMRWQLDCKISNPRFPDLGFYFVGRRLIPAVPTAIKVTHPARGAGISYSFLEPRLPVRTKYLK